MSTPSIFERDIYRNPEQIHEARVAMTLSPQMWTSQFAEEFNGALDPNKWWYTQHGGASPLIESGLLKLRTYGGAPREMLVTRKHAFPESRFLAFDVEIRARFPNIDPVYPISFAVGGVEQMFGTDSDPMRVTYFGSLTTTNTSQIRIQSSSITYPDSGYVNDDGFHTYTVQWRPFAPGTAGNHKLTIRYDGTIYSETSHPYYAAQPRFVALGLIQSTRPDFDQFDPDSFKGGDWEAGEEIVVCEVDYVRVTQAGNGYESPVYPSWTTTNLGHTIDTAVPGERFTQDGAEWAILPPDAVQFDLRGGRFTLPDGGTITLDPSHPSSPLTIPNRFVGTRWGQRDITVDTRVGNEAGSYTSWKRRIAGRIVNAVTEAESITLTVWDRPMVKLQQFISRAYTSLSGDDNQQGHIEGVNIGYLLQAIMEDLVDVADIVSGGILGGTWTDIRTPSVAPLSLSTGGQNLQAVFTEICDRLALTTFRKYATSGVDRYGTIVVHLWDFGSEVPTYTFNGRGSAYGREDVISVKLLEGFGEGVGQVIYGQQTPADEDTHYTLQRLPLVGTFPSAPWPASDRVLSDSAAILSGDSFGPTLGWPEWNGTLQYGGVGKQRYKLENGQRRVVEVQLFGGDFVECSDNFGIEDPQLTGLSQGESFCVTDWQATFTRDAGLVTTFRAASADWVKAILNASP